MKVRPRLTSRLNTPIVITGGAGFIGSRFVDSLGADAEETLVVDTFESGSYRLLGDYRGDVLAGDVSDPDVIKCVARLKPALIVHLASITDTTLGNQAVMIRRNVEGFRNVLDLAVASGARLVYASSAAVYGNGTTPMMESQPTRPHNVYGFSKLVLDNIAAHHIGAGGSSVIGLRFFNVYGPGEMYKASSASMILQAYMALSRGEPVRLFKHGQQVRDFVHVEEVVTAIWLSATSSATGIINVGSGVACSFNEMVRIVAEELDVPATIQYIELPTSEYQANTLADLTKAREAIGFEPTVAHEVGIRRYVGELRGNPGFHLVDRRPASTSAATAVVSAEHPAGTLRL